MRIAWYTEDPPKEEEEYLVTYSHGAMDVCKWTDASYFGGHKSKTNWHWVHAQYCEVIAWMPLPAPYKAESEDRE